MRHESSVQVSFPLESPSRDAWMDIRTGREFRRRVFGVLPTWHANESLARQRDRGQAVDLAGAASGAAAVQSTLEASNRFWV